MGRLTDKEIQEDILRRYESEMLRPETEEQKKIAAEIKARVRALTRKNLEEQGWEITPDLEEYL